MLDDRRFVITGMSRLAVRVARLLGDRGAEVLAIAAADDELADRLGGFGIDKALSMSGGAAGAFVGAATDERAVRRLSVGSLELVAFRYTVDRDVAQDEVLAWREQGLRIVAAAPPGEPAGPPASVADGLRPGTEIVVAGPEDVLRTCLFG